MSKNILILTNYDAGLYLFRKELIQRLVSEGYTVHVSTPDTGYIDSLSALGALIHVSDVDRRGTNPVRDMKLYKDYRELIREVNPDAVLTYTIKPIVYGGIAARMEHVPLLSNVTGLSSAMLYGSGVFGKFLTSLYKAGLKGASYVFFQNEQNRDKLTELGCVPSKAKVVLLPGSGVNLTEHAYVPYPEQTDDGKIRLLYVGRVHPTKGSDELLKTAEAIHASHPEVIFDIVGDCEDDSRTRYADEIKRLEKTGAIAFYGYQTNVAPYYERCHALVHPTYFEGMSNVILEAASTGRPILASDVPGCKEIFEDGVGGIAFTPRDAASLKEAVLKFIGMSYEDRQNMGCKAREFVEAHFDRQMVVEEYLKALNDLQNR